MLPVAILQMRPRKGRYAENLDRLAELLREAVAGPGDPPALVVAPESALTGYFLEGGVRELAVEAEQLFADSRACTARLVRLPDLAIGFYESNRNHIYNSALHVPCGPELSSGTCTESVPSHVWRVR
jgi:predicted amidohydrolase